MEPPKLIWTRHEDLAIKRRPCVGREEYLDHMTFASNDRPLFTEIFGPIVGLKERWVQQGATQAELDFSAFRYRCEQRASLKINTGWLGGCEVLLEDNDDCRIVRDVKGRITKLPKGKATIALPMDFPVKNFSDWLAVKEHYEFDESRLTDGWAEHAKQCLANDNVIMTSIPGGYDELRELMGDELACMAFYDQPELVENILETISQTAIKVFERVVKEIRVDVLFVHEDFAGKSGPLVGPSHIKNFIGPYYKKIWDFVRSHGARLFDLDSDGNIDAVIPSLLEYGVNCIYPMEPAAGMDMVKVREKFGNRLAMWGGLDKFVLSRSKEDIVRELEYKLPPMIATGGCMLGMDHRLPETTPLDNYKFYLDKVWEIIDRETK